MLSILRVVSLMVGIIIVIMVMCKLVLKLIYRKQIEHKLARIIQLPVRLQSHPSNKPIKSPKIFQESIPSSSKKSPKNYPSTNNSTTNYPNLSTQIAYQNYVSLRTLNLWYSLLNGMIMNRLSTSTCKYLVNIVRSFIIKWMRTTVGKCLLIFVIDCLGCFGRLSLLLLWKHLWIVTNLANMLQIPKTLQSTNYRNLSMVFTRTSQQL